MPTSPSLPRRPTCPPALLSVAFLAMLAACTRSTPDVQTVSLEPLDGSGIVAVDVRLDRTLVDDADSDSVALVEVRAVRTPDDARATVHVALVLDTSGSMEGTRLDNAREAAHRFIDSLGNGDRVTLVSYGDNAQTLLGCHALRTDRSEAHEAIDRLVAEGNTCVSCGLQAGYDQLASCGDFSVRRVVLFSDGHANRGVVDDASLRALASGARDAWRFETATIGLGRLHDEERLAAIAEAGAADYHFIHNSELLAQILEEEIADLHSTAVTDVRVTLSPGDGVSFHSTPMLGAVWTGDALQFDLGQMASGESRALAVRLALPAGDPGRVLRATVEFLDAAGRGYRVIDAARVERSDDPSAIESSIDSSVVEKYMELAAATAIDTALDQFESGSTDGALATIEIARESLTDYATSLGGATAPSLPPLPELPAPATESTEEMSDEDRGLILLQRARNNDLRRGQTEPSSLYAPGGMNLDEME